MVGVLKTYRPTVSFYNKLLFRPISFSIYAERNMIKPEGFLLFVFNYGLIFSSR